MRGERVQVGLGDAADLSLCRELGLADLLFAQITYMLIPEFFGTAAKAGESHVALWLLAMVLFFLPSLSP